MLSDAGDCCEDPFDSWHEAHRHGGGQKITGGRNTTQRKLILLSFSLDVSEPSDGESSPLHSQYSSQQDGQSSSQQDDQPSSQQDLEWSQQSSQQGNTEDSESEVGLSSDGMMSNN